ncbi:DUF402 domain-containing protein [Mycoplasma procyoni]|uniref:DUF402 domain-containing protein n=1 Tax=Mycoplasma procyoni TaxID=568784 RepID=UPI00197BB0F4|nr:DUF402 domain-containing protein [Mycoplasma procyoni]MBN3534841.1 DUF402 domain-containing protein [Mycoplasma procyoni]
MNLINKFVNVQAYKYNGKLYRQWTGARIIEDNPDYTVACLDYKTKVMEKSKQKWSIKEPTLWFFPKNSLYNAVITHRNKNYYTYINLASSFFFEDNTIKFIDYDLDIKAYPQKELNIIDKKEFLTNAKKMKYPKKLMDVVLEELKKIVNLYYTDTFIFDKNILDFYLNKSKEN